MFRHDELLDLVGDICAAEQMNLPGPARHAWVLAHQIIKRAQSPPPVWIWFLILILEKLIPALLDWLKKKYGDEWLQKVSNKLKTGLLPWE